MFIEKDAHCSEIKINSPTTSKNNDLLVKVASMRPFFTILNFV